jgi:DNA mismatch repair protein MutH
MFDVGSFDTDFTTIKDPVIVEQEAKAGLIGLTFEDVLKMGIKYLQKFHGYIDAADAEKEFRNKARKGGLGNLVEEAFFGYPANSYQEADLTASGVEVKATPYEQRKKGNYVAGERLVITMINYNEPVEKDFYNSHVWSKIKNILLIHYLRQKEIKNNLLYKIRYVTMFRPSETDMAVIIEDYNIIIGKIEAGLAHELSEADTNYLGACTKGAGKEKDWKEQVLYPSPVKAKGRAFCYKTSYMTFVLNEYVMKSKPLAETIIQDAQALQGTTFDKYIQRLINKHIGKTDEELCSEFDLPYSNNKAQWNTLAFRMLGVKSNQAEELEKANIKVKTVRVEENGRIKENMSIPPMSLNKISSETWEDAEIHGYFDESKFLFVVFKKRGNEYVLLGAKLWHMPFSDLDTTVKQGWKKAHDVIRSGIKFDIEMQKNGPVINNNLPGQSDNPIVHMRPHASKRYYKLEDGRIIGNGTPSMAEELPDGRWMPKQSFWLNSSYIKMIVGELDNA